MSGSDEQDSDLRARFAALRREGRAPGFDAVWSGARARAERRGTRTRRAVVAVAVAAALALVALARGVGSSPGLAGPAPAVSGDAEPLAFLLEPLPGDAALASFGREGR